MNKNQYEREKQFKRKIKTLRRKLQNEYKKYEKCSQYTYNLKEELKRERETKKQQCKSSLDIITAFISGLLSSIFASS